MILGDSNINVGIGIPGDNNGTLPQRGQGNKLEINADPNSFNYTGLNGSGLRSHCALYYFPVAKNSYLHLHTQRK